ncbi:unnamed protein product [Leuciscus chuanchicus]
MNSKTTTSTDANRQANLPMHTPLANRRSLPPLIAPSDLSGLGEAATQTHLQAFPNTIIDGKYRSFNAKCHAHQGSGTVLNQMQGDSILFIERNRQHFKVVLDVVMQCAKMEIPLRGHRETQEALNKGNFLELFESISKYDLEIKNRLVELPQNATLMSHHIQDELLEAAASLLLRKIKTEMQEQPRPTYFAILTDEFKDVSKRELVPVCVRFIHSGTIKERALGFVKTADLSVQGISQRILEILESLELDPSLCIDNFFTWAQRHARFVEFQKEMHPERPCKELERSCETRWSSKSGSVHKILEMLDVFLETLAEYSETSGRTKLDTGTLATFRDDSDGDFDKVLRLTEELIMSREQKLPAKFSQSIVTTTLGKTSAIKNNGDLRALWNCILGNQMAELNSRFKDDTYEIMRV